MSRGLQLRLVFVVLLVAWGIYELVPTFQYWGLDRRERQALQLSDAEKFDRLQQESIKRGLDLQGGVFLVLEVDPERTMDDVELVDAVEGARRVIEQRVNQYGVSEANVQIVGERRLVVELPGLENIETARALVGRTALLRFNLLRPESERDEVLRRVDAVIPRLIGAVPDTARQTASAAADTAMQTAAGDTTRAGLFEANKPATQAARPETAAVAAGSENPLDGVTSLSEFLQQIQGPDLYTSAENLPKVSAILALVKENAPETVPQSAEFLVGKIERIGTRDMVPVFYVSRNSEMTGASVADALVGKGSDLEIEQAGKPVINFSVKDDSVRLFSAVTRRNRGERLAIVLDNIVYSAPTIQAHITNGQSVITGMADNEEARTLAIAIRSGALPAEVNVQEERYVGPSLGSDSIRSSSIAFAVGGAIVLLFIIAYYRLAGFVAIVGLLVNLLLLMACLAGLHGTLTLPGVAGLVLTIGMAVDANVLIFERIREELAAGKTARAAIEAGYDRAASAIWDGNLTTFITALVLYQFGTGPIRGFALTLGIGIFTSLFAALFVSRIVYDLWLRGRTMRTLSIGKRWLVDMHFPFMNQRNIWFAISGGSVLASIILVIFLGFNWGVDFAGGTRLEVRLDPPVSVSRVRDALSAVPVGGRTLDLATSEIKTVDKETDILITVKQFPDIEASAVDSSLRRQLAAAFPENAKGHWVLNSETVGPKVGSELRTSAIWAIVFSLAAILIYLSFRFEWPYAVASVIALFHDVTVTLGVFALLRYEITLSVVAALLTIVGYSLNDTIVIFDRVREGTRTYKRLMFHEVLDRAINETLSRTIVTMGTTLFTILALLLFGGEVLRDFALALFIGVGVGTYSSIWVASAIVLIWHNRTRGAESIVGENVKPARAVAGPTETQASGRRRGAGAKNP